MTKIATKQLAETIAKSKIDAYYTTFNNTLGDVHQEYLDPLRVYDMLKTQLGKKYAPLMEFEHKAHIKWYGPQGGKPSIADAEALVDKYYGYEPKRTQPAPDGIAYVIREIENSGALFPIRPTTLDEAWIKAMKPTNSGVTHFGKRNDWKVIIDSINHVRKNPGVFKPLMLMTRFSKNKLRAIFNDDLANYLIEAPFVTPLYELLRNIEAYKMLQGRYEFTRYLAREQLLTDNTVSLMGDAEALDTTFTKEAVDAYVTPIMKHIFHETFHDDIDKFHEDLFTTQLVMPSGTIRQGKHSFFSGILPTNIYESIGISVGHYDKLINSTFPNGQSLITEATLFVIGDDIVILLNGKQSTRIAHQLKKDINLEWIHYNGSIYEGKAWQAMVLEDMGFIANTLKQGISVGHADFCKRWFSPHLPSYHTVYGYEVNHSARSLMATINSINNPEYGRNSGADELLRIFGILDDAYGHPLWNNFVDMLFSQLRKTYKDIVINDDVVRRYNKSRNLKFDWVLEGFTWQMPSSPAWHRWVNLPYDITKSKQY